MTNPEGTVEQSLREVCEHLATLDRTPCSAGEREAARWLAERLRAAGVEDVAVEEEASWGPFPPTVTLVAALGVGAAALVLGGRRRAGAAVAVVAAAGLLDEVENGPRILRRILRRRRSTVNVVARIGDPEAPRTLLVLAHHDAAQTGLIYDQRLHQTIERVVPGALRRIKTQPPQWWFVAVAPGAAIASAVSGRRGPALAGCAIGAIATAFLADIWRSPTVAGANDNLSAVALIVALAEKLRDEPLADLQVWLVSAGAEETLQDGVRAFVARHRRELDPERTSALVADTIGSPRLIMCEGEGPFWIHPYTEASFRDLVASCAEAEGIELERGFRARSSTDAVIVSRAGFATAMLTSLTDWQTMSHYHLPGDRPEHLDYGTVAAATRLAHAVARAVAASADPSAGESGVLGLERLR
jgi:hypothetical protein